MKLTKDIIYTYLIFISIFLVFLDAYQFYSIPLSWIGLSLLVPVSIYEIKNTKLSKYSKAIYLMSIPFVIPELFYIFRNELTYYIIVLHQKFCNCKFSGNYFKLFIITFPGSPTSTILTIASYSLTLY